MKHIKTYYNRLKHISFVQTLILVVIAIAPFLFSIESPNNPSEITAQIGNIVADISNVRSTNEVILLTLARLVPFTLFFFWFLTSKQNWAPVLLIALVVYTYQILKILVEDNWWILPASLIIVPLIYLIKLHFNNVTQGIDFKTLESELQALKEKPPVEETTTEFVERSESAEYGSIFDWINYTFSTDNLEFVFRQFRNNVRSWTHLW